MQVDMAVMTTRGIGYCHPLNHDVRLEYLPEPLMTIAVAAVEAGTLSSYTVDQQTWVPRTQLAAVAGFGRKLYDPSEPCFVPAEAMLPIVYLNARIPPELADRTVHQRLLLLTAHRTADYLHALEQAMPPRPFDVHVRDRTGKPSPLLKLVQLNALSAIRSSRGWWVSSADIAELLPDVDLADATSTWFVDPHDYADHDEVARLAGEHRQHWPEIYDAGAPPPVKGPSL